MRKLRPTFNNFSVKKLELRGPVIGINFGFTNSSVAILEERKAKVLKNDEGSFTTPSVVSFTKNGGGEECLVGAPALRQAVLNSQNTVFNIKRLIGRKFDDKEVQDFIKEFPNKILKSSNGDNVLIEIQGKLYSPQQITSFILIKLKEMTENYLNKKVGDAIITVPNYFDYSQKQALKQAGKLANLRILRFVPDSIAAVFGYRLYCFWRGANKIVAVCNLNGGSFEYTVLELKNYDYEIVLNKYDTCLSGVAFNNVIVNYFVSEFKRENGIDLNKDSIAKQRLREAAEKAKCELSNSAQTEIILPNIIADTNGELKHFQIILSRSKFEELTSELTQRIVEICQQTKEEIKPEVEIRQPSLDNEIISQHWKENLPSTGIDQVLLVGGMTRMPKIRMIIEEVFKKEIFISQLEGALALGAVYLGVFFGDINYFDDRRTSKNKLIKMASQKMFIGERKFDVQDAANLFWEVIAIFIKEFYSSLHIDIRSRIAITGLGYFAAKYADRKYDIGYCAINQADYISRKGIGWSYGGEHRDLCNEVFCFLNNFLFINKKKVWSKLKPYLFGEKLVTEEKYMIPRDFHKVKFKRISTREVKDLRKQKLKKYFLFKAY